MTAEWLWHVASVAIVVVYCASLIFVTRGPSGYSTLWDGWIGNIASIIIVVPVLLRIQRTEILRAAWCAMAVGIVLNFVANLLYLLHDQNLDPVPFPAPSDAAYLPSYAAFAIGVAMMSRRSFGARFTSIRLDGLIAGLTIASAAAFWFLGPVLAVTGSTVQAVVGLSYPLFDLLLIVLLVAGLAPLGFRPTLQAKLLLIGIVCFVAGDIAFLQQSANDAYIGGTLLEGTWALGVLFIALASWPRDERRSPQGNDRDGTPDGVTFVPVAFGLISLVLLAASYFRPGAAATVLALGALAAVIARMALTSREIQRATSQSFRDARTDPLTSLMNRRAFLESIEVAIASDTTAVGILLVDLNRFKEVNDSLGHHAGDELLRIVSMRFVNQLGDRARIARIGGDEFAVVCVGRTSDELFGIGQELVDVLAAPVALDGLRIGVAASIGISVSPDDGCTGLELLRSADVAMYAAKRSEVAIRAYDRRSDVNDRDQIALIQELRTAIDQQQLVLHYQPTLDCSTMIIRGVEALVRWHHPTRGLLYPDSFIPLAEQVELMPQLTRAVLELAISEAKRFRDLGHDLQMSVNVSRYDLLDDTLSEHIDALLRHHDVDHDKLTLEVTESCFSMDSERVARNIHELRSRGIRISIDDFGVGYSSMSQLLGLPIDELKIDKTFVLALLTDGRAESIVRLTIQLCRALNLSVVAEGVETSEVLATLRELGVDVVQGYYVSEPLAPDQLLHYLEGREAWPAPRGADLMVAALSTSQSV